MEGVNGVAGVAVADAPHAFGAGLAFAAAATGSAAGAAGAPTFGRGTALFFCVSATTGAAAGASGATSAAWCPLDHRVTLRILESHA